MPLTNKALEAIRTDSDLRAKLMLVDSKSEYTIKRWLEENSDNFTMPKYVIVISSHTGLSDSEILVQETSVA
ncbi:MAG: hypothetical protein KA954_01355 [Chitinophagales bacterium]|nr:hypothetical protein [Chitinophagales bacterium]MBP9845819.1 hypothetical protein [Saprospiraceae bacterium]